MRPHFPVLLLMALLSAGCAEDLRAPEPPTTPTGAAPATGESGAQAPEPLAVAVSLVDAASGVGATSDLYGMSPARLELEAGMPVNLTVTNDGRGSHDLVIEGLDVATQTLDAGESQTILFTPLEAGTYRMYCSIGKGSPVGHDERGMHGEVVVS